MADEADDAVPDPYEAPLGAGLDLADPNSPLAPFYLSASQVVFWLVLAAIFVYAGRLWPLWHTDVWGHVKYGEWFIDHRALPEREPYSPFTDHDQPMIHVNWGSQVIYAALNRAGRWLAGGPPLRQLAGGAEMLRFGHVLTVLAVYSVITLAYRRFAGSWRLAVAALIVLVVLTSGITLFQRPQVNGMLGFALVLWVLGKPIGWRAALLGLPTILVIWANLHGSFAIGLSLLGVTLVGRILQAAGSLRGPSVRRVTADRDVRRLFVAVVVSCVAIAALNPYGPMLFVHVAAFGSHPALKTVSEWQPIRFSLGPGGQRMYLVLAFAIAVTVSFSPRMLTPTQWLWLAVFGVGPLVQQRLMNWWILLIPAVLLPHLALIGEHYQWRWARYQSERNLRKTILTVLPLLVVALYSMPIQWLLNRGPLPPESSLSRATPWRLTAELTAPTVNPRPMPELRKYLDLHYPAGKLQGPVLCSESMGDFLFWALPRHNSPMAFAHMHLFDTSYWNRFFEAVHAADRWQEFADQHGANLIVIEAGLHQRLAAAVRRDPAWFVVVDDAASPGVRNPAFQQFIAVRRTPIQNLGP